MVDLVVVHLILAASLIGLLLVGSLVLQGLFYTETSSGIYWQAPLAGIILAAFFLVWTLLNRGAEDMPFGTVFQATGYVNLVDKPVKNMWVIYKGKTKPVEFTLEKEWGGAAVQEVYRETADPDKWWVPEKIASVIVKLDPKKANGREYRFTPVAPATDGGYRVFVSPEGWTMTEYERGVNGQPEMFDRWLFSRVLILNFAHFVLWVMCLWLILRFQFWTAFGLSLCLWFAMTLIMQYGVFPHF